MTFNLLLLFMFVIKLTTIQGKCTFIFVQWLISLWIKFITILIRWMIWMIFSNEIESAETDSHAYCNDVKCCTWCVWFDELNPKRNGIQQKKKERKMKTVMHSIVLQRWTLIDAPFSKWFIFLIVCYVFISIPCTTSIQGLWLLWSNCLCMCVCVCKTLKSSPYICLIWLLFDLNMYSKLEFIFLFCMRVASNHNLKNKWCL